MQAINRNTDPLTPRLLIKVLDTQEEENSREQQSTPEEENTITENQEQSCMLVDVSPKEGRKRALEQQSGDQVQGREEEQQGRRDTTQRNSLQNVKEYKTTAGAEKGGSKQGAKKPATSELRIKEDEARFRLSQITSWDKIIIDYTFEGKAGAALLVLNNWEIVEKGTHGTGTVAWAKVKVGEKVVGVASVHGPRDRSSRARIWRWMCQNWQGQDWIILGDWNNVENYEDTNGYSSVQKGKERRRWALLKAQLDLLDSLEMASVQKGPKFTSQERIKKYMATWRETANEESDPRIRWERKWYAVRELLKEIAKEENTKRRAKQADLDRLNSLRKQIAEDETGAVLDELHRLEKKIKEAEEKQGKYWRKLSRIKWLKYGEVPSKFFFSALREQQAKQEITCLQLDSGELVEDDQRILAELHRFYSDLFKQLEVPQEDEHDTAVMVYANEDNVTKLMAAIKIYEKIAGASLNIHKSVLIPWGMDSCPEWITRLGCKVPRKGEVVCYLGFPIGWGITEDDQCDFMLAKLQRKLGNWKFRNLTFTGRLLVLKHVVRAVPIHVLAALPVSAKTCGKMETVSREFLWGKNREGKPKIPLIAWEKMQQTKICGGLGLTSFLATSRALRAKLCLRIFQYPQLTWVRAAGNIIKHQLQSGSWLRDRREWTLRELLLVAPPKRITKCPTVQGLLDAWNLMRNYLKLQKHDCCVQGSISSTLWVLLGLWQQWYSPEAAQQLLKTLKKLRIERIGKWADLSHSITLPRPLTREVAYCKAHKWGKDASLCKRCALEEENESHLLWSCPKAKEVWFDFNFIAQGTEAEISTNQSFIAALDMALRATLPTKLLCIAAITKVIWQERNYITYQSYFKKIPLRATVQQILLVAQVQMEKLDGSSRNYGKLKAATDTLARLEARLHNVAPQLSPVVPQEDSESSVTTQDGAYGSSDSDEGSSSDNEM
ncbi:hypothetical protein R1sor_026983 [Riccia sorocarpa]|uniref:Reverse transcriptase zinc-binding domain-containing protein n=1 Tax=Riccia sorocarpa TaxID=122646 RepID=A0ABD3GG84_9MARC